MLDDLTFEVFWRIFRSERYVGRLGVFSQYSFNFPSIKIHF